MGVLRLPHHQPRVVRRAHTLQRVEPRRAGLVLMRRCWIRVTDDSAALIVTDPVVDEADTRWAA